LNSAKPVILPDKINPLSPSKAKLIFTCPLVTSIVKNLLESERTSINTAEDRLVRTRRDISMLTLTLESKVKFALLTLPLKVIGCVPKKKIKHQEN